MYQLGFVIEQSLGHLTHGQNLEGILAQDESIRACWGFPNPHPTGLARVIPNWTVSAGIQARQAVATMRRDRPLEALFFHTQVTAVLCQDTLNHIPSIVSLDATPLQYDELGDYYAHKTGVGLLERAKWWLNRNCFFAAHHLVSWSEWTKRSLVSDYHVPPEKITVIPPGANVRGWQRPSLRQLNTEKPVRILFVGGDFERKGGQVLLEAFSELRHQLSAEEHGRLPCQSVELHIVTKSDLPPAPGVVTYRDMKPNSPALRQLYFDCDIFCLPTLGDCLPMVLSEAAAAGLPAVTTSVGAIPEITLHEQTGLLVAPNDVEGLKEALGRLVADPALRLCMGERALIHVQKRFDAERNAWQLAELMKTAALHSRRGLHE